MAVVTFGNHAGSYAYDIDAPVDVLYVDPSGAAQALREAVIRRSNARPFYVRLIMPTQLGELLPQVSAPIIRQLSGYESRRLAFTQAAAGTLLLDGRPLNSFVAFSPPVLKTLADFSRLSDGIVVTSETERRRIAAMTGYEAPRQLVPLLDPNVPEFRGNAGPSNRVVVWAPLLHGEAAAYYAVALEQLHCDVYIVAASPTPKTANGRYVHPHDAANVLADARVIVDTNAWGAETALALARGGAAALVTNAETGAHEWFTSCETYDEKTFLSIASAVQIALAAPATVRNETARYDTILGPPEPLREGPLVSIVIPTRNRRHLLPIALHSVLRQTYSNVEAIVVNDGGESVADLVPQSGNVRLIELEENVGVARACNLAFQQTRGEFAGFLADDDSMMPEHVSRLVDALMRSGESVAHGDVLTAFVRPTESDELEAFGFLCEMIHGMDEYEMLLTNRVGATSVLFRRTSVSDEPLDPNVALNRDYLAWVRLARVHTFVHVPLPTTCYTVRATELQMTIREKDKNIAAFGFVYREHPVPEWPVLTQRREQRLVELETQPPALPAGPPMELAPMAWPPWATAASREA